MIGTRNRPLMVAAVAEAATGLALLLVPSLVGQWLLGEALVGVAMPVARVAGIALIGLGIGVLLWPAVAVHAVLSVLLGHAWLVSPQQPKRSGI